MKRLVCVIIWIHISIAIWAQGFLHASDTRIVDGAGNEVLLRGMGLGGWMLQEGYMLQINKTGSQHTIKERITKLIGEEKCARFYELWLQNHVTKADVDSLAKWGFNSIRLPMHYQLFTLPIEEEPVRGQNTWLSKGFELTDSLLKWCEINQLYLILDLHAAPGGQGKDANISDYDESKPSLWESDLNQSKTVALWKKIAEHYANEPYIGGYDLINEPNWTFEGKDKNGLQDSLNTPIWNLYVEITKAIREVDKNHMIIIEGNGWGNNYNGFTRPWDQNMVLSFHKYWNPNEYKEIRWVIGMRERYNIPVWLGETGENTNTWFHDCMALVEKYNIGWACWPLKKINSVVCPLMIRAPEEYRQLTDYWNKGAEKPSPDLASSVLFEIAENLKAEKCRYNQDVIDAMFRQQNSSQTVPWKYHALPGLVFLTDFDMGGSGSAYNDTDDKNTGEQGVVFRNDGVDIGFCSDNPGNGFQITSVASGEWLQYTLDATRKDDYHVKVRISGSGSLRIQWYKDPPLTNESKAEKTMRVVVPSVQGDVWQTIDAGLVKLGKGRYYVRIIFEQGGYKLNYIDIQ